MVEQDTPQGEQPASESPEDSNTPKNQPQASESPETKTPDQPEVDPVPPEVRAALKKANKEAETLRLKLKEFEDRDLSELERAKRDAAVAAERLAEFERTTVRQRVALEKGLPPSLVDRLQGSTEDEVKADADALMALLKVSPNTPRPDLSQGRVPTPAEQADAEYEQFYPSTPR